MTNFEYKLLKCINKHSDVKQSELEEHFKNSKSSQSVNSAINRISKYLYIDDTESKTPGGFRDDSKIVNIKYSINLQGTEYLEKRQHDFLMFFLPYFITTLIAITNVVLGIARLVI